MRSSCCHTKLFVCFGLMFLLRYVSFASPLDSLLKIVHSAKDTQQAIVNGKIGKIYLKDRKFNEAIHYFNTAFEVSKTLNYVTGEAQGLHFLGKVYSRKSSFDSAEVYFKKALILYDKINRPNLKSECLNDFAVLYYYKGDYNSAVKICFDALSKSGPVTDLKTISRINNNLGNCYYFLKDFKKALFYYQKAYQIELKIDDNHSIANCLGNIGLIYFELEDYDAALKNHTLSYNLQKEIKDTNEMAASLINMALVYEKLNQLNKALQLSEESLKLRRLINDERRMAFSMIKVATFNAKLKDYKAAKNHYEEAIVIALKNGSKQYLMEAYEGLSDCEELAGNYKNALVYHHKYSLLKDSIFSETTAEEIANAEEKYESEKKQRALEILQKDKLINQIKLEKKTSYLYITISIIITIVILLVLLFKQFRLKNKSNLLLEEQNLLISSQKKEITDSINYASIIQRAMLPLAAEFNELFPANFIYYQPKDIVSGDFYWCGQRAGKKAIVVADCTGHGVPGAMMSMVGINLLNQAFNDQKLNSPAEILHFLDQGIGKSLHQNEQAQTTKNSMDLSICIIDEMNNEIAYGGSINPIYLVRNKELKLLKTDKIPIGYNNNNTKKVFNSYHHNMQKGDRIYMFTDGIPDQFGGEKGKKLMTKKFQEYLLLIQNEALHAQSSKIAAFIQNWKGSCEQTDDMLIIGIEHV